MPTEQEKYMSNRQLAYFKTMLENMRRDVFNNTEQLMDTMKGETNAIPDENDRATKESEFTVKLREQDRERRLLHKIESALARVETKDFGNCSECGEHIGLQRLLARPVAIYCFECKNLREKFEKYGTFNRFLSKDTE